MEGHFKLAARGVMDQRSSRILNACPNYLSTKISYSPTPSSVRESTVQHGNHAMVQLPVRSRVSKDNISFHIAFYSSIQFDSVTPSRSCTEVASATYSVVQSVIFHCFH
jgi:hypothetical protein